VSVEVVGKNARQREKERQRRKVVVVECMI
jgi:hypothetical protein